MRTTIKRALTLAVTLGVLFGAHRQAGAQARESGDPCINKERTPAWCIMKLGRLGTVEEGDEDPFLLHRSCGITDQDIVQVNFDGGANTMTKRSVRRDPAANGTILEQIRSARKIRRPDFPALGRLVNYWFWIPRNSSDQDNGLPRRTMLKSILVNESGATIQTLAEDTSPAAQALIKFLDENCLEAETRP